MKLGKVDKTNSYFDAPYLHTRGLAQGLVHCIHHTYSCTALSLHCTALIHTPRLQICYGGGFARPEFTRFYTHRMELGMKLGKVDETKTLF